jgi:hypothetical protein
MTTNLVERTLAAIARSNDPKALAQISANARRKGELAVARAADIQRYAIVPGEEPGTFEHAVWQSINALEHVLTLERGKTTRLQRTRQKITKVGEQATVRDLILAKTPAEGFAMLVERDMIAFSFEYIALLHEALFDDEVRTAARRRLEQSGFAPPTR